MFQTRQKILQISYGFVCDCLVCSYIDAIEIPKVPSNPDDLSQIAHKLQEFVGVKLLELDELPNPQVTEVPVQLRCTLREDFIAFLSEIFSKSSHEGEHDVALDSGLTLLALYLIIYPPNFPQIGMEFFRKTIHPNSPHLGLHLLELAKTTWNKRISTTQSASQDLSEKMRIENILSLARRVLDVYGSEGDPDGPSREVDTLQNLLSID